MNDWFCGAECLSRVGRVVLFSSSLALVGCAASSAQEAEGARRIPVTRMLELTKAGATTSAKEPVVLEVKTGDRLPVELLLNSKLLKAHRTGEWSVEAVRDFYVLLRETDPPEISVDGVNFDEVSQGAFNLGIDATPDGTFKVNVVLALQAGSAPD
jgi:hypothetical protein